MRYKHKNLQKISSKLLYFYKYNFLYKFHNYFVSIHAITLLFNH